MKSGARGPETITDLSLISYMTSSEPLCMLPPRVYLLQGPPHSKLPMKLTAKDGRKRSFSEKLCAESITQKCRSFSF